MAQNNNLIMEIHHHMTII